MRKAKIGSWAGILSVRLTEELKSLGLKKGENVTVTVEKDKIIIEKVNS
jgi:antitoxin component of MazEF toxin-antitoxin module